jgi:ATP-dependent Clp protease ATP-binding subunit ClpC
MIACDLALMIAKTKYHGQFEERPKAVMDEMRRFKNIILFWMSYIGLLGVDHPKGQ